MPSILETVLLYTLIPVIATIVGGVVAAVRPPGPPVRSGIQHFAAGVVFAAVAVELLPDMHEQAPFVVIVGFALGVATMLVIRWVTRELTNASGEDDDDAPASLLATVGVDIVVDGLLIGFGFVTGTEQGILLTLALTVEVLFLGLAVATALNTAGASRTYVIAAPAGLAIVLAVSAVGGAVIFEGLSGATFTLVLAFAAAALLYLVTEELLVEAHEVRETPLITAMFFVGFLLLFVIEMLAGAPTS